MCVVDGYCLRIVVLRYSPTDGLDDIENQIVQVTTVSHLITISHCFLVRYHFCPSFQVWTNTCCSHPLHGMEPPEVDGPKDVADGTVMGAKNAAIRKLDHELGIPSSELDINKFKFLARLHYWAADTVTHGPDR